MNWKILYIVTAVVAGLWASAVALSVWAMFRATTDNHPGEL